MAESCTDCPADREPPGRVIVMLPEELEDECEPPHPVSRAASREMALIEIAAKERRALSMMAETSRESFRSSLRRRKA